MNEPLYAVQDPAGGTLARRAAAAVADRLAGRPDDGRLPGATQLRAIGATFVTLEDGGTLLGCIGSLDGVRPLFLDAMRNATRAMNDPRLPPVTADVWPRVDVTVSVLSEPQTMEVSGPDHLVRQLRVGTDGLILTDGRRRATFLPAVWHKVTAPEQFVLALLRKGGWFTGDGTADGISSGWPTELVAMRYTTASFTDPAPRPPI